MNACLVILGGANSEITKLSFSPLTFFIILPPCLGRKDSNLGLQPSRAVFSSHVYYFLARLIYLLVPWYWIDAMIRELHSRSHDLWVPSFSWNGMSLSVPFPPQHTACPGFLSLLRAGTILAVPWCLVTGSEGWGQLRSCNFSPYWKTRGSELGTLGHVNRCPSATRLSLEPCKKAWPRDFWAIGRHQSFT